MGYNEQRCGRTFFEHASTASGVWMEAQSDMSETEHASLATTPETTPATATPPATPGTAAAETPPVAAPRQQKKPAQGRIFRRTSYARALMEGVVIFAAFRLLEMVPLSFWPGATIIAVFLLLLVLRFAPPVWAALRVVSTKREKMSRRFWKMGPLLAGLCLLVDVAVTLGLGQAGPLGGPDGKGPALVRLLPGAAQPLALSDFILSELGTLAFLVIYYVIAVVCTRLANGGFLRFTMPAGKGRVTL